MSDEMKIAKSEGIACIVDAGHPDMGRDINFLRTISKNSGLPIVASAGFYTQPFYPKEISTWSETQIFDALMKQVNADNIGALGEIGSWDYITKDERKVFRAVGKVQAATGLPVFTHTGIPGKSALEQLDLLEDAGADPKKIIIGHLGNLNDPNTEIQRAVIRRGAFIGFDRQGGANDDPVAAMAASLIDAGYASQLMFSADISSPREIKRNNKEGGGYAKTLTVFVPKVKKLGASDEALHQIMVDNPRRFLAYVPKIKRKA
jgi:phosphotriesterase-related protein